MPDRYSQCLRILDEAGVLTQLQEFSPEFVGSIPIRLDLPESDLDIICMYKPSLLDRLEFFSKKEGYLLSERILRGVPSFVCRFSLQNERIEIVAQPIPSREQLAYLHLKTEEEILKNKGERFRLEVLDLKKKGRSTEEAFAEILELKGDPYLALRDYGANLGLFK